MLLQWVLSAAGPEGKGQSLQQSNRNPYRKGATLTRNKRTPMSPHHKNLTKSRSQASPTHSTQTSTAMPHSQCLMASASLTGTQAALIIFTHALQCTTKDVVTGTKRPRPVLPRPLLHCVLGCTVCQSFPSLTWQSPSTKRSFACPQPCLSSSPQ